MKLCKGSAKASAEASSAVDSSLIVDIAVVLVSAEAYEQLSLLQDKKIDAIHIITVKNSRITVTIPTFSLRGAFEMTDFLLNIFSLPVKFFTIKDYLQKEFVASGLFGGKSFRASPHLYAYKKGKKLCT